MREQDNHYHARSRYKETEPIDYLNLIQDIAEVQEKKGASLNVHLPLEIQHPDVYSDLDQGVNFILFAEVAKKAFNVLLYWENSPEQVYDGEDWVLKHGQTNWENIPDTIDLTLDTGHLMLGARDIAEARDRLENVLFIYGEQIKHVHVHENDLVHDDHLATGTVIDEALLEKLKQGRTYIFERPEVPSKT